MYLTTKTRFNTLFIEKRNYKGIQIRRVWLGTSLNKEMDPQMVYRSIYGPLMLICDSIHRFSSIRYWKQFTIMIHWCLLCFHTFGQNSLISSNVWASHLRYSWMGRWLNDKPSIASVYFFWPFHSCLRRFMPEYLSWKTRHKIF